MEIRSEALPYVLPPALIAAAATAAGAPFLGLGAAAVGVGIGAFFRDPPRASDAPGNAVLSPADGRVVAVESSHGGLHIAIFLSLFNVHVTRAPVSGRLVRREKIDGGYAPAYRPSASHNARCVFSIDTGAGPVELSLIAGAVARRVQPWVAPQQRLDRGQRLALIRFGSRAEVRLPPPSRPGVEVGDAVRAGESVIAWQGVAGGPPGA